jgi:hypothetical protein
MDALPGFQFHRLTQIPRHIRRDGEPVSDDTARGLLAALTGSHADLLGTGEDNAAVMTAWVRSAAERQLRFIVGGRPFFPPALGEAPATSPRSQRRVLFPPGALATDLPHQEVTKLLDGFPCWVPCGGRTDALWAADDPNDPTVVRRGSFDRYAAHLREPFTWLVLARPLRPPDLQPELDQLVNDILPLARGEVSQAKRIGLERKQARHRELARSQTGGVWRIRVLVGATHAHSAATAAAMLCAASELNGLPYLLTPAGPSRPLHDILNTDMPHVPDTPVSFTADTRLLVALTRPPDRELPGLRLVQPHTFDVTREHADTTGLTLGAVLDEAGADVGDLVLPPDTLNRHTFVCGATGTGKSQTIRHLLEQATRAGLPWLVIEPAKAEYARMAARIASLGADVVVIRPGDPSAPPAGLNPLEPAPRFPLQTHADLLRALFLASFEAQEPFPQVLAAALTRCYEELGWDLTLGESAHPDGRPRYPTLGDLQRNAEAVVTDIGYSKEITDNVRGFIKVRLASLRLGTTGRFFEGGHPLDFGRLHARNVVLEIEDVGDDADKAFLMGVILIRLAEHLRTATRTGPATAGLRHLTVIEEAHRLLRRPEGVTAGPVGHAVEMFAALLAEIRAYGEGLIIAEQIPGKIIPDVIKNTAVKIMHRLPAFDDRATVGATMNLNNDQSEFVLTLPNGHAAVFTDGMDHPVVATVPDGTTTEARHVATAPVTGITERRSPTCGIACAAEPCTLRQLRDAQRTLTTTPWLTIWAELAVLAHLTGSTTPVPLATLTDDLRTRQQQRTIDCTLSLAIDNAVAARTPILQPTPGPSVLAVHVREAVAGILDGESHRCDDTQKYLSAPYRWALLDMALAAAMASGHVGPHPRTKEWQRYYRQRIPGETLEEQRASVTAWFADDLCDAARRDSVSYGVTRPSALEKAVGTTAATSHWPRLRDAALRQFTDSDWGAVHLTPVHANP